MSEEDLSKEKPVESEQIQRTKKQEALMKKMTEPSAAMKRLIESESRMAAITASTAGLEAAAKAISANLPVFEKVEMPGAIEAAKTIAAISPNIIKRIQRSCYNLPEYRRAVASNTERRPNAGNGYCR